MSEKDGMVEKSDAKAQEGTETGAESSGESPEKAEVGTQEGGGADQAADVSESAGTSGTAEAGRDRGVDDEESSGIDWESLLSDDDYSESEEPDVEAEPSKPARVEKADEAVAETEAPVEESRSEPPGKSESVQETPSPGKPDVASPEGVAQVSEQAPKAEAEKPLTPEELEDMRRRRQQMLWRQYGLSEEEGEKLISDPHVELPKLLARMHDSVIDEMQGLLKSQLDPMLNQVISQRERNKQLEERFYGRWPQLKGEKYQGDLVRIAQAFRQAFPSATDEELIEDVGLQAMVRFRMDPRQKDEPTEVPKASGEARSEAKAKPFKPAPPKSAGREAPTNAWEKMAEEMLEDDDAIY